MKFKNLTAIFVCVALVFSQSAFAARVGGGKSYGMQRSANPSYSQQQGVPPSGATQGAQPRSGMGAGTAALLGAAAGAAGGYMLGRSSQNNASGGQSVQPQHSFPWGTIGILAILLFLGLMLFRRKANAGFSTNNNQINPAPSNFNIPTINRTNSAANAQSAPNTGIPPQAPASPNMNRMPDGVETMYFLRQVKGMFLHIQSMNNPDNVAEVEKYMTPSLYQEIKSSITGNSFVADFSTLDCQLLDCEVNGNQLIASVKFYGMVSEEPNQPSKPFSEIWNFVKTDLATGKWVVAGIQQETLA